LKKLLEERLLGGLGLEAEPFGGRTLLIRQVPSELVGRDLGPVLRDMARLLAEEGAVEPEFLKKEMAALLACHEAVRSGDRLRDPDREALLRDLDACESPDTCPHGRPTRLHLSRRDLLRMFKRIQ